MKIGDLRTYFRIYRPLEERGELGSVKAVWDPVSTSWGGFVPSFLTMRTYGAGEVPAGTREVELMPGSGVKPRDGVQALAGPEAGTRWRVVSVDDADPQRSRARLEPFSGEFIS